jgi:hypothetical protein
VAAGQLVKFLASKKPGEVVEWRDKAVQWWKEDKDLSELIPLDFEIPDHIKQRIFGGRIVGKIARGAVEGLTVQVNGARPAYDLILQNVHDIAANYRREFDGKNQEVVEVMRQIQVIAAWLGNPTVKPWYYKNMDRAYAKLEDELVGDGDGEPGGGA